ncbi:transposase [Candidatus Sumerlaeota bacterium]|nr:transposase [Candidatus Sumerlaeota bacterium]
MPNQHSDFQNSLNNTQSRRWHHRPAHVFEPNMAYIVTAGTLNKEHFFRGDERLELLQTTIFEVLEAYEWQLQAWAVFSNHYHFIALSPAIPNTLRSMIGRLHSQTARVINQLDGAPGRRVWFQYYDTCLTYENSYYVRLNYVHNNPVKHGIVGNAELYLWCSAAWFRQNTEQGYYNKVGSFRCDHLNIADDY